MSLNPEDSVLQTIWDLENDPLICPVCTMDWHGLGNAHCPGAWASEAEQAAYHQHRAALAPTHIWVPAYKPTQIERQMRAIVERYPTQGFHQMTWQGRPLKFLEITMDDSFVLTRK